MKDSELQWFRPLWLRLLVTALIAIWFGWEMFFTKDQLWMMITGAALAYAVWNLFIRFEEKIGKAESTASSNDANKPGT